MAKSNIQKIVPPSQVPAFLAEEKPVGLEAMKEYIVVSRLKTIQKQSSSDLTSQFNVGDVILSPTGTLMVPREQPMLFTPVFFFVEWMTWSPLALKGTMPAILHRTIDKKDPIVAKSRDPLLRKESLLDGDGRPRKGSDGQELKVRHVEHLNFFCFAQGDHPIREPFILSFSRGEHFTGQKFCGLIRQRSASPFACVFEMRTKLRPPKNGGDWYGIDVANPTGDGVNPWVTEEQYRQYEDIFKSMQNRYVQADFADVDAGDEIDEVAAERTM